MNDMKSKLGIDFNQVEHARSVARKIADGVQDFVEGYTTVAVERTLCRLILVFAFVRDPVSREAKETFQMLKECLNDTTNEGVGDSRW